MGILGIGKGLLKVFTGVAEGDVAKIVKGVGQTALGTITTVVSTVSGDTDEIVNNETDDVLDDEWLLKTLFCGYIMVNQKHINCAPMPLPENITNRSSLISVCGFYEVSLWLLSKLILSNGLVWWSTSIV